MSIPEQEPVFENRFDAGRKLAEKLTEYKKPTMLDTLSVAYAAANRFEDAINIAQKALELAIEEKNDRVGEDIKKHLELYKLNKPYRE